MTLATTPPLIDYLENGVTLVHAIPFQFETAGEIVCTRINLDGTESLPLAQGVDYSVTGGAGGGGTVTKANGGTGGATFRIRRLTDRSQPMTFATKGSFSAATAEGAFDRGAMVAQDVELKVDLLERRSLRARLLETMSPLPAKALLANRLLGFDNAGNPTIGPLASALETLSGYIGQLAIGSTGGVTPEQFGAVGDGVTNDTTAFQLLSTFINAAGGGLIHLRAGATYLVGRQQLKNNLTEGMWVGEKILYLEGLTRPITIRGNGAKFKVANGLKIGTFDAAGNPTVHALPYWSLQDYSAPVYVSVVMIRDSSGAIDVENFEIDGNEANLNWGGNYGDTGWQVGADGLILRNNTAPARVSGVYSHHNGRDGAEYQDNATVTSKTIPVKWDNCVFDYNCRQGLSHTGGKNHTFTNCKFNNTGRGTHVSSPAAGVDFEQEGGIIRNMQFLNCEAQNNTGAGLLCVGDVEGIRWKGGKLIGSIGWAHYYAPPKAVFENVLIVGAALADIGTGKKITDAPVYRNCTFSDDVALTDTGTVYIGTGATGNVGPVSFAGDLRGAIIERCHMRGGWLPATVGNSGTFRNCSFEIGPSVAVTHLVHSDLLGETVIEAAAGAATNFGATTDPARLGSTIIKNGVDVRKGSAALAAGTVIAAGASLAIDVPIQLLLAGDVVKPSLSGDAKGCSLSGVIKTPQTWAPRDNYNGTAQVIISNNTGAAVTFTTARTVYASATHPDFY